LGTQDITLTAAAHLNFMFFSTGSLTSVLWPSAVLLKMEVGIRRGAWQTAWRYPAYLWSLRWVYAVKKTPEVGISRIPVYTPQYTTALTRPVGRGVRWVHAHTPQISTKCKIKNTDTVHNAPCIEERSTFLQRHSHFPLFFTTTPPIFHFFYKKHPPQFHFVPTGLLMLVS